MLDGEQCDDSNTNVNDGCDRLCRIEEGWDCANNTCTPISGDGIRGGDA